MHGHCICCFDARKCPVGGAIDFSHGGHFPYLHYDVVVVVFTEYQTAMPAFWFVSQCLKKGIKPFQ